MKRISLFLVAILMLVFFIGCSDNKAPKQHKKEYVFTHEDSTQVINLVDRFVKYMDENDIRSAVEMLSILKGDSLIPLEPVQMRRQAMALSMVKGVKWEVNYLIFNSDKDNEVKLDVTLFEKEENDPKPNMTAFFFRPVKFEGQWYLTVKDNITDRANGNNFNEEEESEEGQEEE